MEIKTIKLVGEDEEDALFKSAKRLSKEIDEEIDSSTFITVEDALTTGSDIMFIKDLPLDKSDILMDFVFE